jgi:hypothetical protein
MTAQANGLLPQAIREAVVRALVGIGFDAGAVLQDYAFSIGEGQTAKADLLAFADPRHRTPADYAAISAAHRIAGQEPREQVDTLSKSGALFHLLHEAGTFQLWVSDFDPNRRQPLARRLSGTIAPDRLSEALGDYGADLTPERIVGVKQGREWFAHESLRGVAAQQMTLWVMDVNRPLLLGHFEAAVKRLQKAQDESGAWDDNDTTRMSVQLLGAVVLADTDVLGTAVRLNRDISLERLWAEGHRWFPDYFQPIVPAARQAAEAALEILRAISYSGFQPEMLVDLYKEAYRKEQRRRLGRFDTPMYLTRAIWEHIPVEMLPPDQRLVCDMTSGWGSFLVAGYERLARLGDMRAGSLSQHLIGNDLDLSAALLARFGLLISTGHDSWKVHGEDALRWRWLDENRPTVIVGNPPFSGSRKEVKEEEGAGRRPDSQRARQEKAVAFFERAIDRLAPDGYLAMVMPLSFVASESGTSARERLYQECDLLDIWEVPNSTFPDANVAPAVIFARKRVVPDRSKTLVSLRTVQAAHMDGFRQNGVFTAVSALPAAELWRKVPAEGVTRKKKVTHQMYYNLVLTPAEWAQVRGNCVDLSDRTVIFPGCTRATHPRRVRPSDVAPYEVEYLHHFKKTVTAPLQISYDAAVRKRYPTEFEEPRLQFRALLGGPKVVINSTTNPSWGKRLTAAVERKGNYVSDKFWGLVPSEAGTGEGLTLEAIAAVLSWPVANGWIVGSLRHGKLPKPAIEQIPFPAALASEAISELTAAVRTIEGVPAKSAVAATAWKAIDRVLQDAYGITDAVLSRLQYVAAFSGKSGPAVEVPVNPESQWLTEGIVEAVSAADRTITLWLNGFDELQTVPIQPHMPAWLLREGAPFRTSVSDQAWKAGDLAADSHLGRFTVGPYAYLDDDQVLDRLAAVAGGGH